jgi:diaminopimelate epimerase
MSPTESHAVSTPDGSSSLHEALNCPGGFIKMHGAGNDFIVFDGRTRDFQPDPAWIASLCNRHTGIGGDQVLVLETPNGPGMDIRLRIFNIDGQEAQTCLNATRCVVWLMLRELGADLVRIGTGAGVIVGFAAGDGRVTLKQPAARFDNVGVAEIVDDAHMKLVVWERPGILTQACGSGACAAAVVARRLNLTSASRIEVIMPGGRLLVEEKTDGTLLLTGPVEVAFMGHLI